MVILQGVIAQQAATQGLIIGGAGGSGTLGARPGMGDPDDLLEGNRRPGDPGLAGLGLVILKLLENMTTNRYNDNESDKTNCELFQYKDKKKKCKDGNAHHVVPDRAFRSPGTRNKWTPFAPLNELLNDAREEIPVIGQLWKGGYYNTKMDDENEGWAICVSEKKHKIIHNLQNPIENQIGLAANPQYISNLKALEELGAKSVSAVTGCNASEMADTLRKKHQEKGMNPDYPVRADPYGNSGLNIDKFNSLVTKQGNALPR